MYQTDIRGKEFCGVAYDGAAQFRTIKPQRSEKKSCAKVYFGCPLASYVETLSRDRAVVAYVSCILCDDMNDTVYKYFLF